MDVKSRNSEYDKRIKELEYCLRAKVSERTNYDKWVKEYHELKDKQAKLLSAIPEIGDKKYSNYPNKQMIDTLRLLYYERYGIDPNINYNGCHNMFDNSLPILSNVYKVKENVPYEFRIKSSDNSSLYDPSASILTTIPTESFLDDKNEPLIELMVNYMNEYTNKPINLIFSNSDFKNISFARIDNKELIHLDGFVDYYHFFVNMFDGFNRNIIYIGPELQKNIDGFEIDSIYRNYIMWEKIVTSVEARLKELQLHELNDEIKGKVLKYCK